MIISDHQSSSVIISHHQSSSVIIVYYWSLSVIISHHQSSSFGHLVIWSLVIWSLNLGRQLGPNLGRHRRNQTLGDNRDQTKGKFNGRQPGPNLGTPRQKEPYRSALPKNRVRTLICWKQLFGKKTEKIRKRGSWNLAEGHSSDKVCF